MKKELIGIFVLILLILAAMPSMGQFTRNILIKDSNENNPILNDNTWVKFYGGPQGDHCNSVMQTKDGGYILVGETRSFGNGNSNLWLIKTDSEGNKIWDKIYGGNDHDYGEVVKQTSDGGYIITGATNSFGYNPGSRDYWLIKTDSNGNILWELFSTTGDEYIYDVKQTNDGGYIFVGYSKNVTESNGEDFYILKTDNEGKTLWEKLYDHNLSDRAHSVEQTIDGGYIICGSTYTSPPRSYDIWLIKTDSNGEMEWNQTYRAIIWGLARMVHQTSDGGYIIAGNRDVSEYNTDIWVIKTDSEGNRVWERVFGEAAHDEAFSVFETNDGNYIVAGNQGRVLPLSLNWYDILLVKLDVDGNEIWKKTIGGLTNEGIRAAQQTSDNGFILGGYRFNFTIASSPDIILMKTDPEGNVPYNRILNRSVPRTRTHWLRFLDMFPILQRMLQRLR